MLNFKRITSLFAVGLVAVQVLASAALLTYGNIAMLSAAMILIAQVATGWIIVIAVLNIPIKEKNVQRRILVKVIVFFIPVFVLIQAVLWEENIKSAVNQTAAAVPV